VTANITLPIYLDHQATTPVAPQVLDEMLPYFTERFGNPHSKTHEFGWIAEGAVAEARGRLAKAIGARPKDLIFTSGATEANNLAIQGAARAVRAADPAKDHLVTVATEHACVLNSVRDLAREGFRITILSVNPDGLVDLDRLAEALTPDTALVSVMAVNNEIGVIQPIAEIGAIARERDILFHTDAAQALGKIPVSVRDWQVDLMSVTAHKVYGPKGIGALYARRKPPVPLAPIFSGGGQEQGFRSGTLSPPLCIGFAAAADLVTADLAEESARQAMLRDRLWHGIQATVPDVHLNGHPELRVDLNLNVRFDAIDGEDLMLAMKDLAVSSGSACTSESIEPSHVLLALGLTETEVAASIRFGLGRSTTEAEIDYAVEAIRAAVTKLRAGLTRAGRGELA